MLNSLFKKIMGSYIIIPLLILLALIIFLPQYLEDYLSQSKREELIRKGQLVSKIIKINSNQQELTESLSNLEQLLDTSLVVVNSEGRIINQGRQMRQMMNRPMGMNGMMKHRGMMGPGMMKSKVNGRGPNHMMHGSEKLLGLEDELNKVLEGKQVTFQGNSPMLKQPIIAVGIPVYTSSQLALFLISPIQGLQEMVFRIRNLTLQITLGAIILALVLGYFISRGITSPVQEMKDKAQRMAAGNFEEELNDLPDDEIGELGTSFNYMSQQLEKNMNALATEKSRMEEMLTSMTEGVLGITIDEEVVLANSKLEEIFEFEEKIINQKFSHYFPGELVELVEEVLTKGVENSYEFEWQDQIIAAQAAPVEEKTDKLWGVIILVRDVTEIRKLDEMRRLFVANVSHELKTPLTAVRGYLEAILDGVIDDEQLEEEYLRRVLRETDRMSELVTNILDLSRLQSGQMEFELEEVDLISLIESVVVNLESRLKDRDVTTNMPHSLIIETDPRKLEEVVINLLSNAIKFTTADGNIEIKVISKDDEIVVEVIDDGVGIPKTELPYIWERFHQVDRARCPDEEGTGLGLAIVKEIVEGLDGEITVESTEGVGSNFSFSLPLNTNKEFNKV
ncbi:HAMP domain-containing sensor histidine kinase [Halanaerocella petrolearia]